MTLQEYYAWLKRDWAKAGLPLSVFLFIFLFIFVKDAHFVIFLLLLQTPLYMLHQAEEYIFPGGFGKFFNMDIMNFDTPDQPLDKNFIFTINVGLIWIILPLFGFLAIRDYAYGLWIPYFSFFAGVGHIALGIKSRKRYNPGLIVSLLLNIPVGAWSVLYLVEQGVLSNLILNPHFFIGLGVNLLLPVIGVMKHKQHQRKLATTQA